MNDIWGKLTDFLGTLNGENTSRREYVTTPEYQEAEKKLAEAERQWEIFINELSEEDQRKINYYLELVEEMASCSERRAYLQGYTDCIQILVKMGLLKENKKIEVPW